MSTMEIFHGYFRESNLKVVPEDTDDFYELEEKLGVTLIKVQGVLYEIWKSNLDIDEYGYSVVLPDTGEKQLMCYWYNGGASFEEVASEAINKHLNK